MKTPKHTSAGAALSLLAALALPEAARAQDDAVKDLVTPESTVELGIGVVTNDNSRFGQYTGLRKEGAYGIGNLDIVKRDNETGTWTKIFGRDLGYQSREMRFDQQRQGNWGYFVDFNQTPAYSPYTVNTGLVGLGTASQTISTVGRSNFEPKTQRDALSLGFEKILWNGWSVDVNFKNEEKNGSRLFGRGDTGFEFLAEPVNWTTRQAEANLQYTGSKLQLRGGYYGTWFSNSNTSLSSFGGTNSSAATLGDNFQTIALPPDNRSSQFNLAGGYNFTSTTRMDFKLASAQARQTDAFPAGFFVSPAVPSTVSLAPGAPGNLGAKVDTTQAQIGLSARPLQKLSLRADLRYENRDDKTPIFAYLNGTGPTSTTNGDNEPRSLKSTIGKLEASYQLPMGFRAIGGIDYDQRERNPSAVRIVTTRARTEETSYRAELRRSVSESVTGSIAYVHSNRGGSSWLPTTLNDGTIGSNLVAPMYLADRDRDKWRAVLDWTPTNRWNFHFVAEDARDNYTTKYLGMTDGSGRLFSADAEFAITDAWQATAFISRNDTRSNMSVCRASTTAPSPLADSQSYCPNTAANESWDGRLRTLGDAVGFGLRGKPNDHWELGANLQYYRDRSEQRINVLSPGAAAADSFPNSNQDRFTLNLYSNYKIDKSSKIRLSFIHDRFKTDDWTWTSFVYGSGANPAATDGTTISQQPVQNVSFIGLSYLYSFR
ncbi:MAG: MtrB/PioB family decaheme-associated outer membrane protein [Burkholderiales bacterium]